MTEVSGRRLARSALLVNAGQLWGVFAQFVLTPIVLAKLGLEGYGVWSLVVGLTSYVTMIDTSFSTAYGKLTAELDRRRDYRLLAEAIGSGIAAIGAVALVLVALLVWGAPFVLPLLGVPEGLREGARQALGFVALAAALQVSFGCVLRVLEGFQRLDLRVELDVVGSMVEFAVSLGLLQAGFGLAGLGVGYLAGRIVAIAGAWLLVRRVAPALALSPLHWSRRGLREVLSLGARFQGLAVLNTVAGEAIRMTISALCGVSTLGALALARRLLNLATTPAMSIIAPLLAAFAHLDAGGDRARWEMLLQRASKLLSCAALAALGFLALFAEPILYAWTARRLPEAVLAVRVLALSTFCRLLTGVGTAALRAAGTVRLELLYGVVGAVASLLGTAIGFAAAGFPGVLVGLAAAQVLGAGFFLWGFAQVRSVSLPRYLAAAAVPAVAIAPALGLALCAALWLPALRTLDGGRTPVLASLVALIALTSATAAPLLWWGVFSAEERITVKRLLPVPRARAEP